jgi:hypothetical protein
MRQVLAKNATAAKCAVHGGTIGGAFLTQGFTIVVAEGNISGTYDGN